MGNTTTFAIAVGSDPADLTVEATDDGFGSFQTAEEAALRLIEVVDSRITTLRASRNRAKRLLRRKDSERAKAAAAAETAATPAPASAPADDGWISWEGGECPVPGGPLVDVRCRDGYTELGLSAWCWRWDHRGIANDIVAYRIMEGRDG